MKHRHIALFSSDPAGSGGNAAYERSRGAGLNLGQRADYPDWGLSWFPSV
jgi:hypothetical protein